MAGFTSDHSLISVFIKMYVTYFLYIVYKPRHELLPM